MIEYVLQSPENITSYEIQTLLPLFIIIPLILFRKRVNAGMIKFVRSQMAKQVIQEFDKDGDETLSKEEYSDFFSMIWKTSMRERRKTFGLVAGLA